ncbi:MAG: MobF family relaxase [Acidimicrobiales bacterium]
MLRVTAIKATSDGLAQVVQYYEAQVRKPPSQDRPRRGAVDYYLDENEPPGRWWGDGAEAIGQSGEVESGQLARMLVARHPVTGARAGRGFGEKSARVFDATFSAPKSASVIWALSPDPWVRAEVAAAHDAAVSAALGWFQTHGAVSRRGRNGVDQVPTAGLTAALFRQHTSRAGDPQLHTHAIIWSKVQDRTGTWLALDARFLKFQQRSIGWVYQAAVRAELTTRLGVSWERLPESEMAEIAGVPSALRELFSQRSAQVSERFAHYVRTWMEANDGADPGPRMLHRLERLAAEHSRPNKGTALGPETLRAEWTGRARDAGVDPLRVPVSVPFPSRDAGFDPVSVPVSVPFPSRDAGFDPVSVPVSVLFPSRHVVWDPEAVMSEALARVTGKSSAWLRADLAREIAILLPADAVGSGTEVVELVDRLAEAAGGRCVALHPGFGPGIEPGPEVHVVDRQLSTRAVLDQEAALLAWAQSAVAPHSLVPAESLGELAGAQAIAARAVAGRARLVLVVGPAGTGKTTMLRTAVAELAAQGRTALGLAPSGKAADVLAREAGCPAMTLAKLLDGATQRPPAGTTILLDEAGMAATEDLDRLVGLVRAHGWRLVCVGDPFQLPSVGRGGMFAYWCERLPAIHIEEVHRFAEPWEAEASLRLRAGDPTVAEVYAGHDRLRAVHPVLLSERVARRHLALADTGDTVAITTASAATAREINQAIQHHEGHWRAGPGVRLHDATRAWAGDTVATRRNDRTLLDSHGNPVRNRQTWTVDEVGPDGALRVRDPDRGEVLLPADYVSRYVELGWAVTGYGNQGVTTDHAICVIEAGTTRADAYVGMTRGRQTNIAFVADPTGTADPAEVVAGVIQRPANGVTAHAVRDRLHGQTVMDADDDARRMAIRLAQLEQRPPAARRPVRR